MSNNSDFKERIAEAIEHSVIKELREAKFLGFDRAWKSQLPSSILKDAWDMVDYEKIKKEMSCIIEKNLAEKVMNMLAQEISTDLKQLLSDKERREEIRAVARENLKRICNDEQ